MRRQKVTDKQLFDIASNIWLNIKNCYNPPLSRSVKIEALVKTMLEAKHNSGWIFNEERATKIANRVIEW